MSADESHSGSAAAGHEAAEMLPPPAVVAGDMGPPPAAPVEVRAQWRPALRRLDPDSLEYVPPYDVVDEDFKCSVCLSWPVDPVVLNCPAGHMICRACVSRIGQCRCPVDRQPFSSTLPAQRPIQAVLARLEVSCPYRLSGCSWVGRRDDVLEHCSKACDFAVEICLACGAHVRRCEQEGHLHELRPGFSVMWAEADDQNLEGQIGKVESIDDQAGVASIRFPGAADSRLLPLTSLRLARSDRKPGASRRGGRGGSGASRGGGDATDAPAGAAEDEAVSSRRAAEIETMLDIYEQAEKLNVCFLVDCTGSMSAHIIAVKRQIHAIVRDMAMRLPSMQLYLAFVGYRDHCSRPQERFETLNFTTSVDGFRDFVAGVCAKGGGDTAEDIHGGLDVACGLQWGAGGAATRVLIHIADAPCHGKAYHTGVGDGYPDGDPHGLSSADLLRRLREMDVQYVFGSLNHSTDLMVQCFDEEAGGNYIQSRSMRDTRSVTEAVTASLHTATSTTVSTLTSAIRASIVVETSDELPHWPSIAGQQVQLRRCAWVDDISSLLEGADPSETCRFTSEFLQVKMAELPFSQGETRVARFALVDGEKAGIAKHMKPSPTYGEEDGEEDEADSDDGSGDLVSRLLSTHMTLSEVSAVACFLAEKFSATQEAGKKIRFLESHVASPTDAGAPFNLEDALPAAEFRRFSNNIGWWERDSDRLLMEFTRWTHEATDGFLMVVDLQGAKREEGWLLTDPCILCKDVTRFGSGNLGPRAMERCAIALRARLEAPDEPPVEEAEPSSRCRRALPRAKDSAELPPHKTEKVAWSGEVEDVDDAAPVPRDRSSSSAGGAASSSGVLSAVARTASAAVRGLVSAGSRRRSGEATPEHTEAWAPAEAEHTMDLDAIIDALMVPSKSAPKASKLPKEKELKDLLTVARETLISQPMLLELEAPVNVLGDIHGQFQDLLRHFEAAGPLPESNYLFLGDYVDRGRHSLETIVLLLALKVKYPENLFLLRGNHECASVNRIYGFYDECKRRYNIKLWKRFCDVFNCFPAAALIDEKIFCCHGGPSPELSNMDCIRRLTRPTDVPDTGLLCDLLWADPDADIAGWHENDRGVSYTFGADVLDVWMEKLGLDLVARAHQVVEDGYEFFSERRLVTVFSAPAYCGEFDNNGAMMTVNEDLMCSFKILKPRPS